MKNKLLKVWTSKIHEWFICKARIYKWLTETAFNVNAYVCDAATWERLSQVHTYKYYNLTLDRIIEGLEEINKIQ